MALEYFDGFDDYSVSQATRYWTNVTTSGMTIAANGRNGTNSLRISSNGNGTFALTMAAAHVTVSTGFALRTSGFGNSSVGSTSGIVYFVDAVASNYQVSICVNSSGQIQAFRGFNNGTLLGTSSFSLLSNVYYYIEVLVTISSTVGVVTVKVNGNTVLNLTSQNTQNTANASTGALSYGNSYLNGNCGLCSNNTVDYDDLYIDNAGTLNGDCRVETVFPSGAGASTGWTATGAASNWQAVSENPADDDTSYNAAASAGLIDLYAHTAISTTAGNVIAVLVMMVARDDSAGTTTIASECRSAGANHVGSNHNISSTTYAGYFDVWAVDPATSSAWAVAAVNSAQFGMNRIA